MRYGYVYVAVLVVIVAIGIFVIFQQESEQSEQRNSIPPVITSQNPNETNQPTVAAANTPAGCERLGMVVQEGYVGPPPGFRVPCLTTTIGPDQITVARGHSANVTVYLNYKYVPGFNAPQQLVVNMVQEQSFTALKILANQGDEKINSAVDVFEENGTLAPGLIYTGGLVSYPNPGPIVLNANETKSVIMKITIPLNFPEELLNRGIRLAAGATTSSHLQGGGANGFWLIVNG